jgi:hypothetical protein
MWHLCTAAAIFASLRRAEFEIILQTIVSTSDENEFQARNSKNKHKV